MLKGINISKAYGTKRVLNNVSTTPKANKLIAYIGANGAGKSTLLSILTRTLDKSEGVISLEEREIHRWNQEELAKRIGILKQHTTVNIRLTVYDLVSFGRYPYSKNRLTKDDYSFIDDALGYLGIEHLRDRFLDELSGGQRQLAYIAMVLAQDTEYIFLDEPLNNLDMKHAKTIMTTLRRLVDERGKTVIIVIHDINFAARYADYVVAFKNGEIHSEGSVEEVIKDSVLSEVFETPIKVTSIDGARVCLYY